MKREAIVIYGSHRNTAEYFASGSRLLMLEAWREKGRNDCIV